MKTAALAAACLLAAALPLHAAQKSPKAKPAPTQTEPAPQDIDVDAIARAKDGKPTDAASADAATAAPKDEAASATEQAPPTEPTSTSDAAATSTGEPAPPTDASAPARPTPLAPPSAAEKSLVSACESRATALLDAAQKGDFAAATRDFDANMRSKLKPEQFKQAWDSLAQFGTLQARGQSHAAESQGYIAITVPLIFEKTNLYAQVACGSDGRVAGFYVKPIEGTPAQ